MDQQTRTLLKAEIEVYLAKFPDASVNQVLKFSSCQSTGCHIKKWQTDF